MKIKKISYILLFIFIFTFSLNVSAKDFGDSYVQDYSWFDMSKYDNFIDIVSQVEIENNVNVDFCYIFKATYRFEYRVQCVIITDSISKDSWGYYFPGVHFWISSDVTSYTEFRNVSLEYVDSYAPIFWSKKSMFADFLPENYSASISDSKYASMSDDLKKYYDFQVYLETGKPLYSYYELLNGTWQGYNGKLNVYYCINGECSEEVNKVIEYSYDNLGDQFDVKSLLDLKYQDYYLEDIDYIISAGNTTTLQVNYYSMSINYMVNYYFDDVLQDNLTETLSSYVGKNIVLKDLDYVKDNIYFLDSEREYSLVLSDDVNLNVIDVYYYTKDVNYFINIYLDDIYYKAYSSVAVDKVGSEVILSELDNVIDIYTLSEREYKLSLTENEDLNYINVYYYSDNYETKFQDIDTSDKFYIAFDWVYIKDLFSLNGNYTQTEQFIILYVVNFLFYAIIFLFIYVGLKMLYKLFQFFKMF